VTDINLRENGIAAEGALALADMLKVNTSVANINLCDNGIGAEGTSALADALKVNSSSRISTFGTTKSHRGCFGACRLT
jgi:hypothetical protein